ncbi:MAG: hypothetical protein ACRD52_17150, partial [Candidatus Acidiferrales bacterium]
LGAMTIRPAVGYVAARNSLAEGYWALIAAATLMAFCGFVLFARTRPSGAAKTENIPVLDRPI